MTITGIEPLISNCQTALRPMSAMPLKNMVSSKAPTNAPIRLAAAAEPAAAKDHGGDGVKL